MLKKFFATMLFVLTVAANCSAMTFQSPVEIGSVSIAGGESAIKIFGATNINATQSSRPDTYVKGTANFGELYLHFDGEAFNRKMQQANSSADMMRIYDEVSFFGGRDVKNSVPIFVFEGVTTISRIANDAGLKLYLLATETGGGGSMTVIGERGGKWVKFFNTSETLKTYNVGRNFYMTNLRVAGDEIIFGYRSQQSDDYRELQYKWDAVAQWFGVAVR